jgi:zinc D-Ala-D-Ala carboxypeptidase
MVLKHFTFSEFDCKSGNGLGKTYMDYNFLFMLDKARTIAKIPFVITSGYRTKEYNKQLMDKGYKASPNSSHCLGLAADIKADTPSKRFIIVKALMNVGISRIGISNDFIHCDIDTKKTRNLIWTY